MIAAIHGILEQAGPVLPVKAGLIAWLDAGKGIVKDASNNVTGWNDQSGAGNNFSNATSGAYATHKTGNLGNPCVNFLGAATQKSPTLTIQDRTIFIVKQFSSSGDSYNNIITHQQSPHYQTYAIKGGNYSQYISGSVKNSGLVVDFNPVILRSVMASGSSQIYKNGAAGTAFGVTMTSYTEPYYLGAGTSTTQFNGDVYELLIYNRGLTSSEQTEVEGYLKSKYGFTY